MYSKCGHTPRRAAVVSAPACYTYASDWLPSWFTGLLCYSAPSFWVGASGCCAIALGCCVSAPSFWVGASGCCVSAPGYCVSASGRFAVLVYRATVLVRRAANTMLLRGASWCVKLLCECVSARAASCYVSAPGSCCQCASGQTSLLMRGPLFCIPDYWVSASGYCVSAPGWCNLCTGLMLNCDGLLR